MLSIHPVQRRLAEIQFAAERRGGYELLTRQEKQDLYHCLHQHARLIRRLDELKNLSFTVSAMPIPDTDWLHEVCAEIDKLESQFK